MKKEDKKFIISVMCPRCQTLQWIESATDRVIRLECDHWFYYVGGNRAYWQEIKDSKVE